MRILFTIFPATAHLYPIVPLAWALQTAGHEVCVSSHSGVLVKDMVKVINATGLTAVSLGVKEELYTLSQPTYKLAEEDRPTLALDPENPVDVVKLPYYLNGMFTKYYAEPPPGVDRRPMVDELVRFAQQWQPDLIIWDPLCAPAAIAAQLCGAAHGRLVWGQDNLAWLREKHLSQEAPGEDKLIEWLHPMLAHYGLEYTEETLFGQFTVDLVPPKMRIPLERPSIPVRRVPYAGASTPPDWLLEPPKRKRVCLTLGVSTRQLFKKHHQFPIADVIEMMGCEDVELVATLNDSQLATVGLLPDNVRSLDFVPLPMLLPTCSAIIHHGGGGTFAAAVAARVPQLVIPVPKWDENVTGRYVADRGAGLTIAAEDFTVDLLRENMLRLLDEPSFQEGADILHAESAALPGPNEIVPVLEKLTAQHRL
jgi:glycosyltransferase (activator-dependent family)